MGGSQKRYTVPTQYMEDRWGVVKNVTQYPHSRWTPILMSYIEGSVTMGEECDALVP